ncbi:unnamed protein product [Cochlearia groenlandica]
MESQKQERGVKEIKRVTKIIALASIFSLILSYTSLISSLQQRLHLLSLLVDKKYMFLLCNGIIGFVLRNLRENSETLLHGKAINIVVETKKVETINMRKSQMKKAMGLLEEKDVSKKEESVALVRKEEEEVALVVKDDDDDDGILVHDLAITRIDDQHDDNDDDDEIHDGLLSSEELNKKCEEFIKKMKAEIRLESMKLIKF